MLATIAPRVKSISQGLLSLVALWVVFIVVIWFTYPEGKKYDMISIFAGLVAVTMLIYIILKMKKK